MKIYDISQELFSSRVYPGDPSPNIEKVLELQNGDSCNLSKISLCTHNGTHLDAPYHFIDNGTTIDKIDLQKCIGICEVIELSGQINNEELEYLIPKYCKKLLIKGNIEFTVNNAVILKKRGIELLGVEGCTVGTPLTSPQVHKELLTNNIVIIEGLELSLISTGKYFLFAAPLKLGVADGAPCRAVLIVNGQEDIIS